MDDWITMLLLLVAGALGSWGLGIAGFVQARQARREIAALRAQVGRLTAAQPPGQPAPAPEPVWQHPVATPAIDLATAPADEAPAPPALPDPAIPAPAPVIPAPRKRRLEDSLALNWTTWLGAVALLLAGVFLVRTAVDEGWLGPPQRCAAAAMLGLALAAAAEWLQRRSPAAPARPDWPDYAPGALAAGSAAALFGAAYATASLYALVPPLIGFVLLAASSAAGLLLSLRFGPLAAAVGVAGAYATPLLAATSDPSLAGLFIYLAAVNAAAMLVVRYTGWAWLGWSATVAGAAWVALAGIGGALSVPGAETWAPALFVPAAAALHLGLLPSAALDHPVGRRLAWVPLLALGCAGLWLAELAGGAWPRAGVLLLLGVAAGKAAMERRLDRLPWLSAVLGLAALWGWALPPFFPDPEPPPLPPGLPAGHWDFLYSAAAYAAALLGIGLWGEYRRDRPLRWTALAAVGPVLVLAAAWWRAGGVVLSPEGWCSLAVLLAGLHTAAAARAARPDGAALDGARRAGAHAAAAAASLCLGAAIVLSGAWLTVAVALLMPALAWIEARSGLRPLRLVALAVTAVVLVRLLLNWNVLDYPADLAGLQTTLLAAYALPALAFALAAWMFRQSEDDLLVGVLTAGSCAFATALVSLQLHKWGWQHWTLHQELDDGEIPFREGALHATAFWALAWATQRFARDSLALQVGWRFQAAMGLAAGIVLLAFNPIWSGAAVGPTPVLNALLPAYALPALLAFTLRLRWPPAPASGLARHVSLRGAAGIYAMVSAFAWVNLELRHLFHPDTMAWSEAPPGSAELWAYTGVWLLFAVVLMAAGLRRTSDGGSDAGGSRILRMTALGVAALAVAKAVLVDMSDLTGLWRVLSFLGLGLTLIALGAAYRRFGAPDPTPPIMDQA